MQVYMYVCTEHCLLLSHENSVYLHTLHLHVHVQVQRHAICAYTYIYTCTHITHTHTHTSTRAHTHTHKSTHAQAQAHTHTLCNYIVHMDKVLDIYMTGKLYTYMYNVVHRLVGTITKMIVPCISS